MISGFHLTSWIFAASIWKMCDLLFRCQKIVWIGTLEYLFNFIVSHLKNHKRKKPFKLSSKFSFFECNFCLFIFVLAWFLVQSWDLKLKMISVYFDGDNFVWSQWFKSYFRQYFVYYYYFRLRNNRKCVAVSSCATKIAFVVRKFIRAQKKIKWNWIDDNKSTLFR